AAIALTLREKRKDNKAIDPSLAVRVHARDRVQLVKLAPTRAPVAAPAPPPGKAGSPGPIFSGGTPAAPRSRPAGRQPDSFVTMAAKSAVRSVSSSIGRQIANQVMRGVLGSIFGGGRRR
nr:DUF853 family protein [Verrucomicrobiota bacterium]